MEEGVDLFSVAPEGRTRTKGFNGIKGALGRISWQCKVSGSGTDLPSSEVFGQRLDHVCRECCSCGKAALAGGGLDGLKSPFQLYDAMK